MLKIFKKYEQYAFLVKLYSSLLISYHSLLVKFYNCIINSLLNLDNVYNITYSHRIVSRIIIRNMVKSKIIYTDITVTSILCLNVGNAFWTF